MEVLVAGDAGTPRGVIARRRMLTFAPPRALRNLPPRTLTCPTPRTTLIASDAGARSGVFVKPLWSSGHSCRSVGRGSRSYCTRELGDGAALGWGATRGAAKREQSRPWVKFAETARLCYSGRMERTQAHPASPSGGPARTSAHHTPLSDFAPRCFASDRASGTAGVSIPGQVSHRPDRNETK